MNDSLALDLNTRLVRAPDILFASIDNDKVMVDVARSAYFGLNEVAGEIWELLAEPLTPAEICAALLERFEVDAATCQGETLAVLERMLRLNLVHVSTEAAD